MSYSIQLYVNGQLVDMFKDESISITSTIQNVRDIGKVFSDFSKGFSVPASKANNKIFKHYYNPDVNNGFDARIKHDAIIEVNYLPFKVGKIRLDEVEMRDNKAYAYRLTFFGGLVTLKDILGEDKLDGLQWLSNFDVQYNFESVVDRLGDGLTRIVEDVTYEDVILTPLISADERWVYDSSGTVQVGNLHTSGLGADFSSLKYAIRVYVILKAIEKQYNIENGYSSNIVFSDDFFNTLNDDFYGLYMWLNRYEGKISVTEEASEYLNKMPVTSWFGAYFNPNSLSIYDIFSFSAQYYTFTLNLNVDDSNAVFNIYLEKDNGIVYSQNDLTGNTSYVINFPDITENGSYRIKIEYSSVFTVVSSTNIQLTRHAYTGNNSNTFNFTANQSLGLDKTFDMFSNMPKMRVIDFLTGLFNMFNLTAYYEDNVIIVKTLDEYYSDGGYYDITSYVDTESSTVTPYTIYKDVTFRYSDTKSAVAKNHLEQFNEEWGTEEYNIANKYDGDKYTVTVPFSHFKYERLYDVDTNNVTSVQWGWAADKVNDDGTGQPYLNEPLLFYPILISGGNQIKITNGFSPETISQYYVPSNSISLDEADININFKAELNEYENEVFLNTLFYKYYTKYIYSVFDYKSRIFSIEVNLPVKLMNSIKLNDTIVVNQRRHIINAMTLDLSTGKANMELVNTDDLWEITTTSTSSTSTSTSTTTKAPAGFTVYARTLLSSETTTIYYNVNGGGDLVGFSGMLDETCSERFNITGLRADDVVVLSTDETETMKGVLGTSCPVDVTGATSSYTFTLVGGDNDVALAIDTGAVPPPPLTGPFWITDQITQGSENASGACKTTSPAFWSNEIGIDQIVVGSKIYASNVGQGSEWIGQNKWYGISNIRFDYAEKAIQIDSNGNVIGVAVCELPVTGLVWQTTVKRPSPTIAPCDSKPWSISPSNLSVRFDVVDSQNCGGTCQYRQAGTATATITVGAVDTYLSLSFSGNGEKQDDEYEKIFFVLDGLRVAEGKSPGGKLGCQMGPVVTNIIVPGPYFLEAFSTHTLLIDFDTMDALFHVNAYYQIDLSFTNAE